MNFTDYLKAWPLYLLPHHWVSRLIFRLTRIRSAKVQPAIRWFIRAFKVDMNEAKQTDPAAYESFNAFFTRELQEGARPLASGESILSSPADGVVSQCGGIQAGRIFQAKGIDYSAFELLGGSEERAKPFIQGSFVTIYLSPRDYHRVHMPLTGTLLEQVYVPGRLFSVAPHTVRTVPRLFTRNERVVAIFDTQLGKMALVLVGAINVAAIETLWSGLVTPPAGKHITVKQFAPVSLQRGQEMGRFNMGSTVILLLASSAIHWSEQCNRGAFLKMGEYLGTWAE
ncbi:MAG: phosphatidylserine decarboxylase [Proteobacteria bacterium]|nr:MAG: phosphatidylserine decarboxylase [Pseudomonadota bacterium]